MDMLARDSEPQRASPQEARLWGTIGVALVIGVLAVVGFAWNNDRQRVASIDAPIARNVPAMPELPPIP